ncbi:MAG: CHASE2 domain-containing protein [Cyanobacteria bacterium J06642_11]
MEDWVLNLRSGLISKLSIVGLLAAARLLGLLQPLEWKALDVALRWRPPEGTDDRITILAITEEDIQQSLAYPISDQSLTELIDQLQQYEPRVIGLDIFRDFPVGEGYEELSETLAVSTNLIGISKVTGDNVVAGPEALPDEQVGFVDTFPDSDGILRRSVLAGWDNQGDFQFSFTIRMAAAYLAQAGVALENGVRDPEAMRFGKTEIPHFFSHTGGYAWTQNAAGIQTLINYRAGSTPFKTVTYGEFIAGDVEADLLRDRIVLIGYQAESAKDVVSVAALPNINPSAVPGIVFQAHAISQIVSAVLDDRPFLKTLPRGVDYILLIVAGGVGLGLAAMRLNPYIHMLVVVIGGSFLGLIFYGAILSSWWLPIIPVVISFATTAVVLYPVYQMQAQLKADLTQREQLIDWTFSTIHNGPLQTLARLLKSWPDESNAPNYDKHELKELNQELRALYDMMRQEMLEPEGRLALSSQNVLTLDSPLVDLLDEVYRTTIRRRQDFFGTLLHITDFQDIEDSRLSVHQKRELGRFLEEALLNVCKYATGTTRIKITCRTDGNENIIRVVDNGQGKPSEKTEKTTGTGYGTQQAQQLARSLSGTFNRSTVTPKGTQCELRWPIITPWSYSSIISGKWLQPLWQRTKIAIPPSLVGFFAENRNDR